MICHKCADAAARNAKIVAAVELGALVPDDLSYPPLVEHPEDCECTCQHKPVGSWKGVKR